MYKIKMPDNVYYTAVIFWTSVYLFLGYISLRLDDPESRVALVWFPAGVAVSAFLSTQRNHWLLLYTAFFCARTVLDIIVRHPIDTSLALSLISLTGNMGVSWVVQHFSRQYDALKKVVVWVSATFSISVLTALLAAIWLTSRYELFLMKTMGIWWAANVSGTIIASTILTGITWERTPLKCRHYFFALAGILLVGLSTSLVFRMSPASPQSVGLIYGLACIPVFLTVIVPLTAGNQAGAISFLTLCLVVIFFSWQHSGPFFIQGLSPGESLLLAQCYLSSTAILMIFIRLLTRQQNSFDEIPREASQTTIFRLDTLTNNIDWDLSLSPALGDIVSQIRTKNILLDSVSTTVKQQMLTRWDTAISGTPVRETLVFRLTLPDKTRHTICEQNLFYMPGGKGGFIIGYWSPVPGSLPLGRTEVR